MAVIVSLTQPKLRREIEYETQMSYSHWGGEGGEGLPLNCIG